MVTVTEVIKNFPHISVDAIDEFDIALERLKPLGNTQEISRTCAYSRVGLLMGY